LGPSDQRITALAAAAGEDWRFASTREPGFIDSFSAPAWLRLSLDRRTAVVIPEFVDASGCHGGIGARRNFAIEATVLLMRVDRPRHQRHALCRFASPLMPEGMKMNLADSKTQIDVLSKKVAEPSNFRTGHEGNRHVQE
jgi:hypothetical protein